MCGRQTQLYSWQDLHSLVTLTTPPQSLPMRYNIAPTQDSSVIKRGKHGERELHTLVWGLIPAWAKEKNIGYKLFNARAETINSKPSFRSAFKSRRCLIPASGFYEWQKLERGNKKQPFYIKPKEGTILVFAGIWERWESPTGDYIESYSIITTTCNEIMRPLHDRMPVILERKDFDKWLDTEIKPDELTALLKPCPAELLTCYPVSTVVNAAINNLPECIAPLTDSADNIG